MKLNKKDFKFFVAAQCRAWGCLAIWVYNFSLIDSISSFLGYLLFVMMTEYFYHGIRAQLISKGKT